MFSHLGLVLSHVSFTPVHVVYIYEHVRDLESPDQYPDCGLQVSSCFPSIQISTLTVDFSVLAVCALLLDSTSYEPRPLTATLSIVIFCWSHPFTADYPALAIHANSPHGSLAFRDFSITRPH